MGRVFEPDGPKGNVIQADDVSLREGKQDGRVSGDDELRSTARNQLRHAGKQGELPLRRERRLRLVHDDHACLHPVQKDRKEGFAVGLRMK